MIEGGLVEVVAERTVEDARLSPQFADVVARAALDAKQRREIAEARAAMMPRWRIRQRREASLALVRAQARERQLIGILGGSRGA